MIPTPLARSVDICSIMLPSAHKYFGSATLYQAQVMGIAAEVIATPMFHAPGLMTGAHKKAQDVQWLFFSTIKTGHKLGPLVAHLQLIPLPDNLLTPLQMLTSSCEVKFQNGEVLLQGDPAGSMVPALMNGLICTDIVSTPACVSWTSLITNAWHFTSLVDLIAGWIEIWVQQFFEFITFLAGDMSLFEGVVGKVAGSACSSVAGAAVRAVGREYFGYRGPISVGVDSGVGGFSGGLQVTSHDDGSWTVEQSSSALGGLGGQSESATVGPEGQVSTERNRRLGNVTLRESTEWRRSSDGGVEAVERTTASDSLMGELWSREQTVPVAPAMDFL